MARNGIVLGISIAAVCVGLFLVMILVPLNFGYLHYYEMGLVKGRTTGRVIGSDTYGPGGRYSIGPANTFQYYPSDAHFVQKPNVSFVTADKLDTSLDLAFAYFIVPENLSALHYELFMRYQRVVENRVVSAAKNKGIDFKTSDFFERLPRIQEEMHAAVRKEVEPELYVTVPLFKITGMRIPPIVSQKQLQTAVQQQVNDRQLFINQAAVIRRETERIVNEVNNNATLTRKQAAAEAHAGINVATSAANFFVESARIAGTRKIFESLRVKGKLDKPLLDFVFGLVDRTDVSLKLGYRPELVQQTG